MIGDEIDENFCGVLDILNTDEGRCNCHFSVVGDKVTVVPLTQEAENQISCFPVQKLNKKKYRWLFGYTDTNKAVGMLQTAKMATRIFSSFLGEGYFRTPLLLQAPSTKINAIKTFTEIEFYGGIVDLLYPAVKAIEYDTKNKLIRYNDVKQYTHSYDVKIERVQFEIIMTIHAPYITSTEIPDLKNKIHSAMVFSFKEPQAVDEIVKYYNYALSLFQFCTGRLNIDFSIRLYNKDMLTPIFVKLKDSFADYANQYLHITRVIRLDLLNESIPVLLKLLQDKKKKPLLSFLPCINKHDNVIEKQNVSDLCVAFEREYAKKKKKGEKVLIDAAQKLTEDLIKFIDSADSPEDVMEKAKSILNSQLKNYSPSLKEKMIYIYKKHADELRSITERKEHVDMGIIKHYSEEEFIEKIGKFVKIRNSVSHVSVEWNEGTEIFIHLKILVYLSVLERIGISKSDRMVLAGCLFGHLF